MTYDPEEPTAADPHPADPPILNPAGAAVLSPPLSSSQDVIQQQTSAQDYVVLRFAVLGLLIAVAVSLGGVLLLAYSNKNVPEGILAIGSAAVGALSTMLVRPPLFPPARPPTVVVPDRRNPQ